MSDQQLSVIRLFRKRLALMFVALVLTGFSVAPLAEGWFVGGGIVSVNFEDDFKDVDRSGGIGFSGGYRFDDNLSAELIFNLSAHEDTSFEDDVLQSGFMAGAKYSFAGDRFKPYGVLGVSLNNLRIGDLDDLSDEDDFDNLDSISGLGIYLGFGADIFVARQHAINVGFRSNRWNDRDGGRRYDVQTDIFSVAYNFYFAD